MIVRPERASVSRSTHARLKESPPGTGVPVCGHSAGFSTSMSKDTYTQRGSSSTAWRAQLSEPLARVRTPRPVQVEVCHHARTGVAAQRLRIDHLPLAVVADAALHQAVICGIRSSTLNMMEA